jgi:hypothetical protein
MVPGSGGVLQSDFRAGRSACTDFVGAKQEASSGLYAFENDEFGFHIRR